MRLTDEPIQQGYDVLARREFKIVALARVLVERERVMNNNERPVVRQEP